MVFPFLYMVEKCFEPLLCMQTTPPITEAICKHCHAIFPRYTCAYLPTGDIAVDWISDKVYWTIRDEGRIEELDLDTNQTRVVVQLERRAAFNGLAVYPYPNNG